MAFTRRNSRQELNINILTAVTLALLLTVIIYIAILPFQESYLGNLLLRRGITQYFTIFTACLVASITLNKYLKINQEQKIIKKLGIPENVDFSNHQSIQLVNLQEDFNRTSSMVTSRLARVFTAYIQSGSRKTVTEFALDDSSFYLGSSESSYALPRILVWAIPLLGFIGTVIGISTAVSGFTGFLENTGEIDQIKEGIGSVTSGLAVAFDTTLLALLLSVVVMIPLVLVEKMESQLLLATDIYINDNILPRLPEKSATTESLNTQAIEQTITKTIVKTLPNKEELIQPIKEAIPSAEELISPAQIYAQEAAKNLVKQFIEEFQTIHQQEEELVKSIQEINQAIKEDRQNFMDTFGQQNDFNRSIIENIRELMELVKDNNQDSQDNLKEASLQITSELQKVSQSLEAKVISLEKSTEKLAELNQLQSSLNKIVEVLNTAEKMQDNLANIQDKITLLEPTLKDLSKPRVVRLVEQIEP